MRILLTADTVGGVWTYSLCLARALAPHGVEVALATMGDLPDVRQERDARSIPGLQLYPSEFKLEWMQEPWEDVRKAGDWLLGLERELGPDIIHLNGYCHAALPWRAPKLVVGHSCVCSWWEAVWGGTPTPEWDRYRAEVTRGLRAADLVIAPTRAMLSALERHYGRLPHKRAVPNGQDPALYRPGAKEPLIFSAGRLWDEAKNVGVLERIAGDLPWPVYLAGEVRHPDGLPGAAPVGKTQVRTLGRLSPAGVGEWLGRASIYALPARYEPFGLSALEAAFAGCALVLGDIPSLREVWGDAALFVPPNDPGALREALTGLTGDPGELQRLAARGRKRAFEYTPERMASGYLTAYRCLIERRQAAAEEVEDVLTEEPACAS